MKTYNVFLDSRDNKRRRVVLLTNYRDEIKSLKEEIARLQEENKKRRANEKQLQRVKAVINLHASPLSKNLEYLFSGKPKQKLSR